MIVDEALNYCNADGTSAAGWDLGWGVLSDYTNGAAENPISGLEACCVCGGGLDLTAPTMSGETVPPTAPVSPPTTGGERTLKLL